MNTSTLDLYLAPDNLLASSAAYILLSQHAFNAADSCFSSLTTLARASGLTPFSHKLTRIERVCLSSPQLSNKEISYRT